MDYVQGERSATPAVVLDKKEGPMLVLSRKVGEAIRIGTDIVIIVRQIKGDRVSVGIEAPITIRVLRGELQALPPPTEGFTQRV